MNHEGVRHDCPVALLLIDVINDLEFEEGQKLVEYAVPMAKNIARLKLEAKNIEFPAYTLMIILVSGNRTSSIW